MSGQFAPEYAVMERLTKPTKDIINNRIKWIAFYKIRKSEYVAQSYCVFAIHL